MIVLGIFVPTAKKRKPDHCRASRYEMKIEDHNINLPADIVRKAFRRIVASNSNVSIYVATSASAKRLSTPSSQDHGKEIGIRIGIRNLLNVTVHTKSILILLHGCRNIAFVVERSSFKVIKSS